jgi:hypothetical protein
MAPPIALPLDWLRSLAEAFLPDLAAIARYTEQNTADGVVFTWTLLASDVPCRVARSGSTASERPGVGGAEGGGVVRAISDWEIWVPWQTDVTERDRITVTVTGQPTPRTYEVNRSAPISYETHRQCLCTLVT